MKFLSTASSPVQLLGKFGRRGSREDNVNAAEEDILTSLEPFPQPPLTTDNLDMSPKDTTFERDNRFSTNSHNNKLFGLIDVHISGGSMFKQGPLEYGDLLPSMAHKEPRRPSLPPTSLSERQVPTTTTKPSDSKPQLPPKDHVVNHAGAPPVLSPKSNGRLFINPDEEQKPTPKAEENTVKRNDSFASNDSRSVSRHGPVVDPRPSSQNSVRNSGADMRTPKTQKSSPMLRLTTPPNPPPSGPLPPLPPMSDSNSTARERERELIEHNKLLREQIDLLLQQLRILLRSVTP